MNNSQKLFMLAKQAREQSYSPYSNFAVGAAVLSTDGQYFSGCNVENISYPCGTCAEQNAIAQMITAGSRQISEILIIADTKEPVTPCGACLQRIKEFSSPETLVHLANLEGIIGSIKFNQFLPLAFENEELCK